MSKNSLRIWTESRTAIGIKALASHPRKSVKRGEGQRDVSVSFAGVTFRPGEHLYADADGVVVAARPLDLAGE